VVDSQVAVEDNPVVAEGNSCSAEAVHRRRSYRTGRRTCFPD
jgi:hypothetical protein